MLMTTTKTIVNSDVESSMSKTTHQEELVGRTLPPPRTFWARETIFWHCHPSANHPVLHRHLLSAVWQAWEGRQARWSTCRLVCTMLQAGGEIAAGRDQDTTPLYQQGRKMQWKAGRWSWGGMVKTPLILPILHGLSWSCWSRSPSQWQHPSKTSQCLGSKKWV